MHASLMRRLAARGASAAAIGVHALTRRLELRIVTLFLLLLVLVQAASFVTIRFGIEANARSQLAAELRTGENVLRRLLEQNAGNLTEAARLLAADFGFRSAITSGDQLTVADALENQAARIDAAAALFTDAHQQLVASTLRQPQPVLDLVRRSLSNALPSSEAPPVQVLDGLPFQLVTVPVKAPQLIGHVSMGFALKASLASDMERISELQMALVTRDGAGPWRLLAIGNRMQRFEPLPAQLDGRRAEGQAQLEGEQIALRMVSLGAQNGHEVAAVLMRSVDAAIAPYRQLQITLLAISLVGLGVFAVGSVVTARRITGPIKALSASAMRLGAGDHATPVQVASNDEVQELAQSFETMRQGMQQREAQIRRLAYWDELTNLPNRAQFRQHVAQQIAHSQRDGVPCAVVMLDLDRFKHVNDVLGHSFGDRLLRAIGQRLAGAHRRDGDLIARLGGDEFAICLRDADAATASQVAERLRSALDQPIVLDDHTVDVGAGVGVATFPAHAGDADTLIGRAEVAMYSAKTRQCGVAVYDPSADNASDQSLSLLSELRAAVEHDELRLFLQPKIDLASGAVLGAEALVRWQHPQRGLVPPMSFIPFAEQTGFIRELTGWMIDRCAARSRALQSADTHYKFAINLSTRDLVDQSLPQRLSRLLARDHIDPETLCLEITESAIMDDPQRALQTLQRLHDMGLRLSIDDFGTGYSSLAYLKKLPLHELKIDRSFVMAMERDVADLKIVRSTIDLAHNLGLSVVAEGVETAQAWALLNRMGCDEAQGYYIAKPMPEDAFADWARQWAPPTERLASRFGAFV
jgi:diguanylate cyclase